MTIDQMIEFLQIQKKKLSGSAKIVAMWDCSLVDFKQYGIQNDILVLDVEDYGCSEVDGFDYMKFESESIKSVI